MAPMTHKKTALITGITGQDGSYLAEYLLDLGYEVHGIIRRSSTNNLERLQGCANRIHLHYGDMTDAASLLSVVSATQPDELYNLAAQSHVGTSFEQPAYTQEVDGMGLLHLLEAVRIAGLAQTTRVYQASTSELYGVSDYQVMDETTPFNPSSPYAIAKHYAYQTVEVYREAYGMFAVNGILFNHESERRGELFVTRKITLAAARIAEGLQECLYLGNLSSLRDWGYAPDYVIAMHLMLQHDDPQDFVIATGESYSVREFCTRAFMANGIELTWDGLGVSEKGIDSATGRVLVQVDPALYRPVDVEHLCGSPAKAASLLGWNARTTSFDALVERMSTSDRIYARNEKMMIHA